MGQQVMMRTDHLAGYAKKLCGRYCGPFAIVAVGRGTVKLDLPGSMKVHATVNVDKVKRYTPSVGEWPGRAQLSRPLPVSVSDDGQKEYEVEAILGKTEVMEDAPPPAGDHPSYTVVGRRGRKEKVKVTYYLVQWLGYGMDDCSWQTAADLANAQDLVADYERRQQTEELRGAASVMMVVASAAA